MLRQRDDVVSNEDGSVSLVREWSCGPIRECSGCPLLYVDADQTKRCTIHKNRRDCQITRIIIKEAVT